MKTLIAALTLGALVATPVLAQAKSPARTAASQAFAQVAPVDAREAALKDCSTKAGQWRETTWGNLDIFTFRACMTQQGQVE